MDAVSLFTPIAVPPLTVTPSQLAVTASDSVSTRQTTAAVPAPVSGSATTNDTARSSATYTSPSNSSPTSPSAQDSNSTLFTAQSLAQENNIPGDVGIASQEAQFTPDVQYAQLVADSFIKYKPSYAGLPQTSVTAVRAYAANQVPTTAPQTVVEG